MALSTEQGFPFWLALGAIFRGWARAEQGHGAGSLGQIREGLAAWRATGSEFVRSRFLVLLAEAYGNDEQVEDGLTTVAQRLAFVREPRSGSMSPSCIGSKGELILGKFKVQGSKFNAEEAEACFQKAIAIAQKQEAKSWELRSATSLAQLWQQQGKMADARELLGSVYNWFTEGFDTADLKDAKALLDKLA